MLMIESVNLVSINIDAFFGSLQSWKPVIMTVRWLRQHRLVMANYPGVIDARGEEGFVIDTWYEMP